MYAMCNNSGRLALLLLPILNLWVLQFDIVTKSIKRCTREQQWNHPHHVQATSWQNIKNPAQSVISKPVMQKEKKYSAQKSCSICLSSPFWLHRVSLSHITLERHTQFHRCLHVKYLTLLSEFNQNCNKLKIFVKHQNVKCHANLMSISQIVLWQTER